MIRRIEAMNFRCLRYVSQSLDDFQVLVGPNASGKTTFLDVVGFLGTVVSEGPEAAVASRTQNFQDLVWGRSGNRFDLAVELEIPEAIREKTADPSWDIVRYELAMGADDETGELGIQAEKVLLWKGKERSAPPPELFPVEPLPPDTLITGRTPRSGRCSVNKVPGGNDNFYSEVHEKGGKGWSPSFKLGPRKSALRNLPADEARFPVSNWLREFLTDGVQQFVLNSMLIRKASPPGQLRGFRPDGSNLPWVIESLRASSEERFQAWIRHVRTALPDIVNVRTVERADDRHRYLIIEYEGGLEVPSWMTSDGTLRLLALTLPAYLPDLSGIFLVEEPENGIHPRAAETVFESLSAVYGAQMLLATHSPVILSIAEPHQVLCFAKTASGAAAIVRGDEHPNLRDWKGEASLGVLFAGGVLG